MAQKHWEPLIEKVLQMRGLSDPGQIDAFLFPKWDDMSSPMAYCGMRDCVERIRTAIAQDQMIVIYGDYDCDGICSVAILKSFLRSLGARVEHFIPNRHTDGYGLRIETLETIAERWLPDLVITVDCGITSVEEVTYAEEVLGFEILVTDHHIPGDVLPECLILNPKLSDTDVFRDLCGAGVTLRLVEALSDRETARQYADIAALATVADVVPLLADNRVIVRTGLEKMRRNPGKGLDMLIRSCVKGDVTAYDIGYQLAPRINAVGRMGDATGVVDLFLEQDAFLLRCLVDEVNRANELRQQHTNDLTQDCMEQLIGFDFADKPCIVLYRPYWEDGVLGIAAARLVGVFRRPVILLTKSGECIKGSGRSVEGIHLFECVRECAQYLTRFGGHAMACGLTLEEGQLQAFTEALMQVFRDRYPAFRYAKQTSGIAVSAEEITLQAAEQLQYFEPFGEGNREPYFTLHAQAMPFEPISDGQHIKSAMSGNVEFVGFGMGNLLPILRSDAEKEVQFSLRISEFRNIRSAQCMMRRVCMQNVDEGEDMHTAIAWSRGRDCEIQDCDIDACMRACAERGASVCFLAHSTQGAQAVLASARNYGLDIRIAYGQLSDQNPQPTLLFRPERKCDLRYFDQVVLAEKPLRNCLPEGVLLRADVRAQCVGNCDLHLLLRPFVLDHANMGKIYLQLRDSLKHSAVTSVEELYRRIASASGWNVNSFWIAFYVFVELGIVIYRNNAIMIQEGIKTKLEDSTLYCMLQEDHKVG